MYLSKDTLKLSKVLSYNNKKSSMYFEAKNQYLKPVEGETLLDTSKQTIRVKMKQPRGSGENMATSKGKALGNQDDEDKSVEIKITVPEN